MKQLIRVALFAAIVAMGFAPAQAMTTALSMKLNVSSSVTPVHCKKKFHCHWIKKGVAKRTKHCHVCGQIRD